MMQLQKKWRQAAHRPMHHSPTITAKGLVPGYETLLVRQRGQSFALADDAERTLCLLSILNRRPLSKTLLASIDRAFDCWERGDEGLAHIHLALGKLGRLDGEEDAWRLFLADALLDAGMSPRDLAAAVDVGLDLSLHKYDPDQPRNPAGTADGGQWTTDPDAGQTRAFQKPIVIGRAASSLADTLGADAIVWLSRLAQRLALPAAVLGAALVPSPNPDIAAEGEVPGRSDLRYHLDHETGLLRLSAKDDPDPTHALVAQLGADGVYREVETRVPIARALDGTAVLIDPDRVPRTDDDATEDDDRPKLCPAPQEDKAGGRKLFDELYQQYVRDAVNPQRSPQLSPELAFALPADTASGLVYFDDCREADGTMIDAKGNYAGLVSSADGMGFLTRKWLEQAGRQIKASQGRRIEWYFHDASAAEFARTLFSEAGYGIKVFHLPYPGGVPNPNPRIR